MEANKILSADLLDLVFEGRKPRSTIGVISTRVESFFAFLTPGPFCGRRRHRHHLQYLPWQYHLIVTKYLTCCAPYKAPYPRVLLPLM